MRLKAGLPFMKEPSVDFWEDYERMREIYEHLNPSTGSILGEEARKACEKLTQEEKKEILSDFLKRINENQ